VIANKALISLENPEGGCQFLINERSKIYRHITTVALEALGAKFEERKKAFEFKITEGVCERVLLEVLGGL